MVKNKLCALCKHSIDQFVVYCQCCRNRLDLHRCCLDYVYCSDLCYEMDKAYHALDCHMKRMHTDLVNATSNYSLDQQEPESETKTNSLKKQRDRKPKAEKCKHRGCHCICSVSRKTKKRGRHFVPFKIENRNLAALDRSKLDFLQAISALDDCESSEKCHCTCGHVGLISEMFKSELKLDTTISEKCPGDKGTIIDCSALRKPCQDNSNLEENVEGGNNTYGSKSLCHSISSQDSSSEESDEDIGPEIDSLAFFYSITQPSDLTDTQRKRNLKLGSFLYYDHHSSIVEQLSEVLCNKGSTSGQIALKNSKLPSGFRETNSESCIVKTLHVANFDREHHSSSFLDCRKLNDENSSMGMYSSFDQNSGSSEVASPAISHEDQKNGLNKNRSAPCVFFENIYPLDFEEHEGRYPCYIIGRCQTSESECSEYEEAEADLSMSSDSDILPDRLLSEIPSSEVSTPEIEMDNCADTSPSETPKTLVMSISQPRHSLDSIPGVEALPFERAVVKSMSKKAKQKSKRVLKSASSMSVFETTCCTKTELKTALMNTVLGKPSFGAKLSKLATELALVNSELKTDRYGLSSDTTDGVMMDESTFRTALLQLTSEIALSKLTSKASDMSASKLSPKLTVNSLVKPLSMLFEKSTALSGSKSGSDTEQQLDDSETGNTNQSSAQNNSRFSSKTPGQQCSSEVRDNCKYCPTSGSISTDIAFRDVINNMNIRVINPQL